MTKKELVNEIATKSGLTKKDSESALNAFIESVEDGLKENKKINLIGFGSFQAKERAARNGVNPSNGEKIKIPAKIVPSFKFSKKLKNEVTEANK